MKRILAFAALLSVLLVSCSRKQNKDIEDNQVWPLGFRTDTLFVKTNKVQSGEVFYKLFTRLGMPGGDVVGLAKACGDEFDVRKLRAGNKVDAWYSKGKSINQYSY